MERRTFIGGVFTSLSISAAGCLDLDLFNNANPHLPEDAEVLVETELEDNQKNVRFTFPEDAIFGIHVENHGSQAAQIILGLDGEEVFREEVQDEFEFEEEVDAETSFVLVGRAADGAGVLVYVY